MRDRETYTRRRFLEQSATLAAGAGLTAAGLPTLSPWGRLAAQERFPVVASEPWGRLLRIADGIWALASDPLTDRTTLCNGGIVAGRAGVVVVEAFGSGDGARWMAQQATRLAGRAPTHVVLTHYHGDHTAGIEAMKEASGAEVLATTTTLDLLAEQDTDGTRGIRDLVSGFDTRRPTEIDLGDRSIILVPRRGHTASDVSVEIPEDSIVFCGDLLWNGMFPNYVDAVPSRLSQAVRLMRRREPSIYVSGHGTLADDEAYGAYVGLLDHVEAHARRAIERGMTAEEAGVEYTLPEGLKGWTLFNPGYFARAIGAWMAELDPARP